MENQLVKIVNESGLEKSKAEILLANFTDYFEIAAEWENKINQLVVNDVSQITEMKMAGEARKFLKQKRIDVENTRKQLKEQSLREGQTIDHIAGILKNLIIPIEQKAEQIEKFRELKEAAELAQRTTDRMNLLIPFNVAIDSKFIGSMPEESFNAYLTGLMVEKEQKELAEKKAEEERLAKEKAEAEERERVRLENERLKKEAEEKKARDLKRNIELKPYIIFIRDYVKLLNSDEKIYQKELSEIKEAAKQHYACEREKEIKLKAEQQAAKEAAEKAAAEKTKLEAELKAIKDAEEKALKEAALKAEKERKEIEISEKAPDKEKLKVWVNSFTIPDAPVTSKDFDLTKNVIEEKFIAFKLWATSQIENIN